jgi:hypothetical protein
MLAIIDPLSINDVKPFWDLIVAPGHETIVHAGREELNQQVACAALSAPTRRARCERGSDDAGL